MIILKVEPEKKISPPPPPPPDFVRPSEHMVGHFVLAILNPYNKHWIP